jgi:hypothetical protein
MNPAGRDFPYPFRSALEPTHVMYSGYRVPFLWGTEAEEWPCTPPRLRVEVKEGVELYLYSSVPSRPITGRNLCICFYALKDNDGTSVF